MSTVNPNTTGLLGLQNPVENSEGLLNIDFAAIGPIGQTGPTGPSYIYQKSSGNLAYTGLSFTIETPTNQNLDYAEIKLATAGSASSTSLRGMKSGNVSIFDVDLQGGNNPTMRVQTDGSFVRGYMAADTFRTGLWGLRANQAGDLDIYDVTDNNPVVKVYKDSGSLQVQSNINNPEIAIANTVYDVNQTAKLKCGHQDAYGYTKSTLIGDNKARLSIGSKNNGGSETDVINIVDGKALINTTTNNGVDALQVNGSISATGPIKINNWTIAATGSSLQIRDSDFQPNFQMDGSSGSYKLLNPNWVVGGIGNTELQIGQEINASQQARAFIRTQQIGDITTNPATIFGSYGNTGVEAEAMRYLRNGNVLIGKTTDTGEKLQVNGSISGVDFKASGNLTANTVSSTAGLKTPNWTIDEDGSNNLRLYDSSDSNPAIVINKSNPKIRITPVVGTSALSGAKLVLYEAFGESNIAYSGLGHRSGNMDIGVCDPSTALNFISGSSATQASTFATFTANNRNLLINKTTDTGEKLQVEGDITCTNLKPSTGLTIGNRWTIDNNVSNHLSIRDSDNNPNMAFFNTGAITVYQTTPNAQFNLASTTAGNLAFFGLYTVSSSAAFRQNDAGSFDFLQNNNGNFSFINGTGRILMGSPTDDGTTKLQINGDIRNTGSAIMKDLVLTAQTQPALKAGQIIYNSSNNKLQFCDGTTWHNISP